MRGLGKTLVVVVLFLSVVASYRQFRAFDYKINVIECSAQEQYQEVVSRLDIQARTIGGITNVSSANSATIAELQKKFDLSVLESCGIIANRYGHGSCVAIGTDLVLTARHCLGHEGSWVEISGRKFDILEQWRSEKYDVGFVRIKGKVPFVELGLTPALLEEVYAVGAPASPDFVTNISKGIVTKIKLDWAEYLSAFVIDATGWYGNSGGPIFNEDGEVAGILVAGPGGEMDNVNVCVPVCQIRSALRTYLSK